MLNKFLFVLMMSAMVAMMPCQSQADALMLPEQASSKDIKENLPQPYIVKKGDTLWDIANYFFKNPQKWLKVWERNLYITNPDLIYPGNEIWFNAQKKKQGGLSKVRPQPTVISKPVERLEAEIDTSMILTELARQDFVSPDAVDGVGYLLDSEDERINYGANDHVYLKIQQPAEEGDIFDIFRTGDPVRDPDTGKVVGVLVKHLGQIEVKSQSAGVYRGMILQTFEEISRGDRIKPARHIDTRIKPDFPSGNLQGKVLYIRNNAAEAGRHQVIGISLGSVDGLKAGSVLSIHRKGRIIEDSVTHEATQLPEELIGDVLVLVAQQDASIVLVRNSTSSINIGDVVRNKAAR